MNLYFLWKDFYFWKFAKAQLEDATTNKPFAFETTHCLVYSHIIINIIIYKKHRKHHNKKSVHCPIKNTNYFSLHRVDRFDLFSGFRFCRQGLGSVLGRVEPAQLIALDTWDWVEHNATNQNTDAHQIEGVVVVVCAVEYGTCNKR